MKKYIYPVAVSLIFCLLFLGFTASSRNSPGLNKVILQTRDIFFKIRHLSFGAPDASKNILIVGIDEESCEKLELRWPWSRKIIAKIIDNLAGSGAKVVGLNLSFTGLEESGDNSTAILAESMRNYPSVVVGATFGKNDRLVKPNALLAETGVRYGFLEKVVDEDYCIRRSYALRFYQKNGEDLGQDGELSSSNFEKSFPVQMIAASALGLGEPGYNRDLSLLTVGKPNVAVYLESDGTHEINYLVDESDINFIPAWKIYFGKFSKSDVEGKVVFLGLSSSLFGDVHITPLGSMPGIMIHANEYLSMITGRSIRFVPDELVAFLVLIISLCVLSLFLMRFFWFGILAFVISVLTLFLGAQFLFSRDTLLEPFILLSGPTLAAMMGFASSSVMLLFENKGLETKIIHDKMTGLYNYDYLRMRLDEEWKACKKLRTPVTLVMTDLDRFKKINDTLGHEVGNHMIIRAGEVIKKSARGYDVVSRYGGDEFVIMLWRTNQEDALLYKNRLRQMYHEMAAKLELGLSDSSVSIGVATFDPGVNPKHPGSAQELIEEADKNLFEDKEARRKPGEARR